MDNTGNIVSGDGKFLVGEGGIQLSQIPIDAQSMSIGQDGTVSYVDADGNLETAWKIELAKFPNPGGLTKIGGNYFKESVNSGVPEEIVPLEGGLEQSNLASSKCPTSTLLKNLLK